MSQKQNPSNEANLADEEITRLEVGLEPEAEPEAEQEAEAEAEQEAEAEAEQEAEAEVEQEAEAEQETENDSEIETEGEPESEGQPQPVHPVPLALLHILKALPTVEAAEWMVLLDANSLKALRTSSAGAQRLVDGWLTTLVNTNSNPTYPKLVHAQSGLPAANYVRDAKGHVDIPRLLAHWTEYELSSIHDGKQNAWLDSEFTGDADQSRDLLRMVRDNAHHFPVGLQTVRTYVQYLINNGRLLDANRGAPPTWEALDTIVDQFLDPPNPAQPLWIWHP